MGQNIDNTIIELKEYAKKHTRVLVGFSGGKDSLVVLDLAVRFFREVIPFYMEFVPGLGFDEPRLKFVEDRFGLKVWRVQHPVMFEYLRDGSYVDLYPELADLPEISRWEWIRYLLHVSGATLTLDGMKKSDGSFRRRRLAAQSEEEKRATLRPIKEWVKWEVMSYLKSRDIPIPKKDSTTGAGNAALGLKVDELLWMHDNYPADYERIRAAFPYIDAIVARRDFFGLTDG